MSGAETTAVLLTAVVSLGLNSLALAVLLGGRKVTATPRPKADPPAVPVADPAPGEGTPA